MKSILSLVILSGILLVTGCNASKDKYETELLHLNNVLNEKEMEIEELNRIVIMLNTEIETLKTINSKLDTNVAEDAPNNFQILKSYEEALELMNRLQIENVVLEKLIINNETYTVVETAENRVTVGTDTETMIYDIPDKSGNIILTLPYKKQIQATIIAIIEEPSMGDWGPNYDHWVKIRMEDNIIGWVRGEYTGMDRGGIKYLTKKNMWLWEHYGKYAI